MSTASANKGGDLRPRAPRVPGPFEGRRIGDAIVALRIVNLSVSGCLIQSTQGVPAGEPVALEIDLPYEGTVRLDAESVNTRPGGYAVKFVHMDDDAREKLERVIEWQVTKSWHNERRP
jgi:hypothetical protein